MRVIYLLIVCSFIYSECDNYSQSQCGNDNNCEWVVDIEYGNCGNISGDDCELNPECNWNCDFVDDYMGWCNYSCDGGPYEIDNSYCQEIEMLECNEEYEFQCTDGSCIPTQRVCNNINDCEDGSDEINCEDCSEMIESQCDNDNNCEWVENIELENCNFAWSESNCQAHDGCEWECELVWDSSLWEDVLVCDCYGQYQVDVGYCGEALILECSQMDEPGCDIDDSCEWIENIDTGSCSNLSYEECNIISDCNWEYVCIQMGWWYNWCYEYGYECTGGNYQLDNGYCEEVSVEYQLGDVNSDYIINILDVIEVISIILDSGYVEIADMNSDGSINVLDVIDLVSIILNNRGL